MHFKEILEYPFLNFGDIHLSLYHVLIALLIIVAARIMLWLIGRVLHRYFKQKGVDRGRQYAIQQFIKYIIYTAATLMAMEAIGITFSLVWGGAAALLVGIGLGLQQTFNDLVSGLILLVEGSIEVDDVVEVDGLIGRVTMIGIRTSKVETRDSISILIPNSKLVGDNVTNWSHNGQPIRLKVTVGVAYSSDVDLVTSILLQAVDELEDVLKTPEPEVQFTDFGNSSLNFIVLFYSDRYMRAEFVKSSVRYNIIKLFRQNKIEIPFPQQDLWLRNAEVLRMDGHQAEQ
jgi:small-conductance mechanosensitive channel